MRIPAYIRRSRHGIFYFRVVIPMALRSRWSGRSEIKMSLKTRDQRQALIHARDLAISAHKSFEYAYRDMSAKPFDPNDQSTWPTAKDDIHKFEKTIETVHPSGHVDRVHYKVDLRKRLGDHLRGSSDNVLLYTHLADGAARVRFRLISEGWRWTERELYRVFCETFGTPPLCNRMSP